MAALQCGVGCRQINQLLVVLHAHSQSCLVPRSIAQPAVLPAIVFYEENETDRVQPRGKKIETASITINLRLATSMAARS